MSRGPKLAVLGFPWGASKKKDFFTTNQQVGGPKLDEMGMCALIQKGAFHEENNSREPSKKKDLFSTNWEKLPMVNWGPGILIKVHVSNREPPQKGGCLLFSA